MTPAPITLPLHYARRLTPDMAPEGIWGAGNTALLEAPLLALLASRASSGSALLDVLELVPEWVRAGRVLVSGFHSPLEQQVLHSVLRRKGRVVRVLARGMGSTWRPRPEEREPLSEGRMLLLTACPPKVSRTTRATALARNRLVLALASEVCAPCVAEGSPLATLLQEMGISGACAGA